MRAPRQGRTFRATAKYGGRPGGPRGCRGAGYVYGSPPRVTGCGRAGPIRVRGRRLRDGPAGGDAPGGARDPSPMSPPGCGLGVGRHPTPCDHEACWGAYTRIYPLPLLPIFPGKRPRRGDLGGGSHFVFCRDWLPPQSAGKRDSVGRGNTGWHEMDEGAPFEKWEPSSGSKDIHSLYFSFTA